MSQPQFEAFRLSEKKRKPVVAFSGKGMWYWENVGDGAQALKAKIVFNLPESLRSAQISSLTNSASVNVKDNKLILLTGDVITLIQFKRSENDIILIELKILGDHWGIWDKGCEEANLNIQIEPAVLPYFIGARCVSKTKNPQLQLSFPSTLEVERSSLFDSQGKGESWRVYELGNIDAAEGEVASLTLKYKGQNFELKVLSTKSVEIRGYAPEAKFAVGFGYDSLSFSSTTISSKESKPIFLLKGLPYKLFWRFGFGIDLSTAFSLTQSENSISYLQILPYGYFRIYESKKFIFEGRSSFAISSQTHAASGGGYQVNQVGMGLMTAIKLGTSWWISTEVRTDAISSNTIKSHQFYDLRLLRDPNKGNLGWGSGIQFQSIKVIEASKADNLFSQSILYGLVVY